MIRRCLLIGILIVRIMCFLSDRYIPNNEDKQFLQCLEQISERCFENGQQIIVSFAGTDDNIRSENRLIKHLNVESKNVLVMSSPAIVGMKGILNTDFGRPGKYFLIFVHNKASTPNISVQLDFLEKSTIWNPRSRFVIVLLNPLVDTRKRSELVRHVVEELWRRFVVNMLVITDVGKEIQLLTWFPFSYFAKCGRHIGNFKILDRWIKRNETGFFQSNKNLFPNKIPLRFHHCTLNVSTFEFEPLVFPPESPVNKSLGYVYRQGLEIKVLRTVAEWSGYKVRYADPPPMHPVFGRWGTCYGNGTCTGVLGNVRHGKADVAFGGFPFNISQVIYLDLTSGYMTEQLFWYVPRARTIPRWKALTVIFTVNTWTCVILFYVISSVISYLLLKRNCVVMHFLNYFSVLIGVAVKTLPKPLKSRFFFIIWVFYSLFINLAFQSKLFDVLTNPSYEKQIKTIEEMIASKMAFGSLSITRNLFSDSEHFLSKFIYDNYQSCPSLPDCFARLTKENFGLLLAATDFTYFTNGFEHFVALDDGIINFERVLYLKKYSPHTGHFNRLFLRLKESGIQYRWWIQIKKEQKTRLNLKRDSDSSDSPISLSLSHLESAFAFLYFGVAISTFVFILEIVFSMKEFRSLKYKLGVMTPWKFSQLGHVDQDQEPALKES